MKTSSESFEIDKDSTNVENESEHFNRDFSISLTYEFNHKLQ